LFQLFRYSFETPKQTEFFCFWFHETNRNTTQTDLVSVCFGSNRNFVCLLRGHPSANPLKKVKCYFIFMIEVSKAVKILLQNNQRSGHCLQGSELRENSHKSSLKINGEEKRSEDWRGFIAGNLSVVLKKNRSNLVQQSPLLYFVFFYLTRFYIHKSTYPPHPMGNTDQTRCANSI
jgi:hypothetical protein